MNVAGDQPGDQPRGRGVPRLAEGSTRVPGGARLRDGCHCWWEDFIEKVLAYKL